MVDATSPSGLKEIIARVLLGEVSQRLVLLGAGASVEAGMPDGSGLDEKLREDETLKAFRTISARLHEADGGVDIERVFRVLEHVVETEGDSLARDLVHVGMMKSWIDPHQARLELERIKWHLRHSLWRQSRDFGRVLAAITGEESDVDADLRYLVPLVRASMGGTIATLNYDNCLEEAGGSVVVTARPDMKRVVVPDEAPSKVRLLKLHGSLDWRKVGDDVVKDADPLEQEEYEPAIIFGAGNKLRHYGPFLDLLRVFREKLSASTHVIAIGYNFRDAHITDALRVWAATPHHEEGKTLCVCMGPNIRQLPKEIERWRTHEHLRVSLVREPASQMIGLWFGATPPQLPSEGSAVR